MWFNFVGYEVDRETEQLDMDRIRDLAHASTSPKIILAGYTAYPREIDFAAFRAIATRSARCCGSTPRTSSGWSPAGRYPSPVPHADVVTFTTHKALRGPRGAMILCREEHAKAIDKAVFPMMQGGPLEHCIAGEGRRAEGGDDPGVQGLRAARSSARARALAAGPRRRGAADRLRRNGLAPGPRRPPPARHRRQGRRGRVRRGRHLAQQERDPVRPDAALDPSGIRVGTPGPRRSGWTSRR